MGPTDQKQFATDAGIRVWLPEIAERVASFLPRNFVTCTLRILDKATAEQFSDIREVQLSQPVPRWALSEHWLAPEAFRGLTRQRMQKLVCLVAASGDVGNLQVAVQAMAMAGVALDPDLNREALYAAAGAGALESCQYIAGELPPGSLRYVWRDALRAAAKGGHHTVCAWCLANGAQPSWHTVAAAYSGGHLELVDMLTPSEQPGFRESCQVLEAAAESCSLAVLQHLCDWAGDFLEEAFFYLKPLPLAAAIGSPTPDWEAKAEFLLAKGLPFAASSADRALLLPPDSVVQRLEWLRAHGCPPDKLRMLSVLKQRGPWAAGAAAATRWLLANSSLDFSRVMHHVGDPMDLDVARSLLKAGRVKPAQVVRSALYAGSKGLPLLRWLVDTHGSGVLDPEAQDGGIDEEGCFWPEEYEWQEYGDEAGGSERAGAEGADVERLGSDGPEAAGSGAESPEVDGSEAEGMEVEGPAAEGPEAGGSDAAGPEAEGPEAEGAAAAGPEAGNPGAEGPQPEGAGAADAEAHGPVAYNRWSFKDAALSGSTELMAFVHEQGAGCGLTFDESTWKPVSQHGTAEGLEWLAQMGCPMPADGGPYEVAAWLRDSRLLRLLRRLGLPWGTAPGASRTFLTAVHFGVDLGTLRWMVAEGCPVDWARARVAAAKRLEAGGPDAAEVGAWVEEAAAGLQGKGQPRGGRGREWTAVSERAQGLGGTGHAELAAI